MPGAAALVQHAAVHVELGAVDRKEVVDAQIRRGEPAPRLSFGAPRVEDVKGEEVDVGGGEAAEELAANGHAPQRSEIEVGRDAVEAPGPVAEDERPGGPVRDAHQHEVADRAPAHELLERVGADEEQADDLQTVKTTQFAVNLVDADESTIAPEPTLVLEGRSDVVGSDEAIESNKDVWKLAAAVALFFVLLEWWVYNRRVFI